VKITIFGQPDDVVTGMTALQAGGALQPSSLFFASNTWGTDKVMQRLVLEASVSPSSLTSAFVARPTSGDPTLFSYCLSQLTQSYDPQYVQSYDSATPSNEVFMPQSQFLAYWQYTFNCGTPGYDCNPLYQLDQVITIDVIVSLLCNE